MAKLAGKRPKEIKSVVQVKKGIAECWYGKPRNMGTIEYRGNYWYTKDGMRFASGRDALEYLVRLQEVAVRDPSDQVRKSEKSERQAATVQEETTATVPVKASGQDRFLSNILAYMARNPEAAKKIRSMK